MRINQLLQLLISLSVITSNQKTLNFESINQYRIQPNLIQRQQIYFIDEIVSVIQKINNISLKLDVLSQQIRI
ncbi:unnamed protein product [Paramecium pentaurelia]|uniref:Transmembrane protein n=1 Tax=Paramecium pentaurelia TaxID=43138 RepID=A0A8S1W4X5_9CILI|nr:unnamed protein product [Paramecium pentaurelia]